jgi:O-antigen/teichoic acid export membrane protein
MTATITDVTPKTESVFKPALLLMGGRMAAFVATFFIPVVLTRVFDPVQFGTYKQLFLLQSSLYLIAQLGMASSLFYFIPRAPQQSGRYVANSLLFLCVAGLGGFALLAGAAPLFARSMNNPALADYMLLTGLYLFLMMLSAPLEMVLISRHRYSWASATYAFSDLARAAAFILLVLVFRQLDWLLRGAVIVASLRMAITLLYFHKEFRGGLQFDRSLLKNQLAYALPFGMAVIVEIFQASLPQYVVSYLTDPATFAIFAVGCLQIPLIDFAASPTSDVMMVQMQERLSQGRKRAALELWHDASWKLALLFFPLAALVVIASREIIVFLYTQKYLESVPILRVWSVLILLSAFPVDGVLRVFARTRLILVLNLVRLAIIAGLMKWFFGTLHLLGPALVIVLAAVVFKIAAIARMKTLFETTFAELLPWRSLANLVCAVVGAAMAALVIKSQLHAGTLPLLLATSAVYAAACMILIWNFGVLNASERVAITEWVLKASGRVARPLVYRRVVEDTNDVWNCRNR